MPSFDGDGVERPARERRLVHAIREEPHRVERDGRLERDSRSDALAVDVDVVREAADIDAHADRRTPGERHQRRRGPGPAIAERLIHAADAPPYEIDADSSRRRARRSFARRCRAACARRKRRRCRSWSSRARTPTPGNPEVTSVKPCVTSGRITTSEVSAKLRRVPSSTTAAPVASTSTQPLPTDGLVARLKESENRSRASPTAIVTVAAALSRVAVARDVGEVYPFR